jgi:hypothetical protein
MTEIDLSSSPNRIPTGGHASGDHLLGPFRHNRAQWLGSALIIAAVLITARLLTPDPRGFGTHTQLGLPECPFLHMTGWPCPTCGLTTCFALLAHGSWRAGLCCHPVGALLFGASCAVFGFCMYAAVRGIAFQRTWLRLHAERACLTLVYALLAQWLTRIAGMLLG